ncbi:hypothetical protein EC9_22000 [Rosistilla ulvae]|uniref:DUF1579 domain-containing protein n=1 Tax=Rosistilla ulvae TaxID=1930277 RepID=A0A517LZG5_9BACT|nr:DUF1579 domain-containing protein [Rosistilla ulvae]QDS88014.1 hypothetical protein EC9_22000 [Rosistilla ulvae]
MFNKPQQEHRWLDQLVGQWRIEQQCTMPDGKVNQTEGTMNCRSVGGLWLIAESTGKSDEGDDWNCIMTLGFDPLQDAYVGSFIASMIAHLWPYRGKLDESGKRLPLDSTGPKFEGTGMARYRDTIEIVSSDEWAFTGELQQEDATWLKIMNSVHYRHN